MPNIITDGDDGRIFFAAKMFASGEELTQEIIDKDTELSDETNNVFIPGKAQAVADGDAELAAVFQTKIDRNSSWRADLGLVSGYLTELINHRAE